ncbi:hypothetical protein C8J57DRAFT_1246800 [Mycena rebaudengoi]|nr:hypothetical protein C8J57DRAFT_1246800 [Mycena rebaudengoi]
MNISDAPLNEYMQVLQNRAMWLRLIPGLGRRCDNAFYQAKTKLESQYFVQPVPNDKLALSVVAMVDGGERLVMTYGGDLVEIGQEWFLTQLFATALSELLSLLHCATEEPMSLGVVIYTGPGLGAAASMRYCPSLALLTRARTAELLDGAPTGPTTKRLCRRRKSPATSPGRPGWGALRRCARPPPRTSESIGWAFLFRAGWTKVCATHALGGCSGHDALRYGARRDRPLAGLYARRYGGAACLFSCETRNALTHTRRDASRRCVALGLPDAHLAMAMGRTHGGRTHGFVQMRRVPALPIRRSASDRRVPHAGHGVCGGVRCGAGRYGVRFSTPDGARRPMGG